MRKVNCFGELLIRFSPDLPDGWKNNSMSFSIGGAELNVATALGRWGVPVSFVTALPENDLSHSLLGYLGDNQIQTDHVVFSGDRIGVYYLPVGLDMKNSKVIYDRQHTSFSSLQPGIIPWEKVFEKSSWFHFSAISPALTENAAAVCKEAVEAADEMGLTISIDLNYRSRLWDHGRSPIDIIPSLAKHCDIMMGNMWAAEHLLGITSPIVSSIGKSRNELLQAAHQSMHQVKQHFPKAKTLAYTFRLEEAYWGLLQHGDHEFVSKEFKIGNVVDKVGSGDCFMAGLIYGLSSEGDPQTVIDLASAAAYGKLFEAGDSTRQTIDEILKNTYAV